jgi:hypothetical protein
MAKRDVRYVAVLNFKGLTTDGMTSEHLFGPFDTQQQAEFWAEGSVPDDCSYEVLPLVKARFTKKDYKAAKKLGEKI